MVRVSLLNMSVFWRLNGLSGNNIICPLSFSSITFDSQVVRIPEMTYWGALALSIIAWLSRWLPWSTLSYCAIWVPRRISPMFSQQCLGESERDWLS